MTIRSPYKAHTVEDTMLVELSDKGEPTGRFRILDVDRESVDKMLRKDKVTAWEPAARPLEP